ncbi:MAG TPA: hypothetical protein PKC18_16910 [Lacipirellulaceae bacterium]|nr:hypothetical protein [Lacipirellulaceae bacterium]HMP08173.1 hypothetical protein [Lacipirellulaceae bacterium]
MVNPFLVVLGPSPGNSPQPGDVEFVEQRPYEEPTVGQVHPKFLYEDARGYWQKVRELSIGVLRGFDPELSAEECYSLSGQTNLGVGGFGRANKQAVDPTYARWVPRVVMEKLRPRIIIMLGLLSLLKDHEAIRRDFASSGLIRIDWKRPDREFRFEQYQQKKLLFRTWRISRPDGGVTTVVSWPNHPSRAPMTNVDLWRASIREGARYLAT